MKLFYIDLAACAFWEPNARVYLSGNRFVLRGEALPPLCVVVWNGRVWCEEDGVLRVLS
jgi:hypothetical protein